MTVSLNAKNKERLKEIFETTVENGISYESQYDNVEYYNLFCKAAAKEKLYKIAGTNLCMFNCSYKDNDSVMMIFYIPINAEDSGAKNIAERVMEIVAIIEDCFVSIDHLKSEEVKEDKFVYVTAIKRI